MSDEFQKHISRLAMARGLPANATTQDLQQHTQRELRQTIGQPAPARFRAISAPDIGGDKHLIELRVRVSPSEEGLASIHEDGARPYRDQLRRNLANLVAGELERSGWFTVRIDNGEAIATLTVIAP